MGLLRTLPDPWSQEQGLLDGLPSLLPERKRTLPRISYEEEPMRSA